MSQSSSGTPSTGSSTSSAPTLSGGSAVPYSGQPTSSYASALHSPNSSTYTLGDHSQSIRVAIGRSPLESALLEAIGQYLQPNQDPQHTPDYSKQYGSMPVRYDDQTRPLKRGYSETNTAETIEATRTIGEPTIPQRARYNSESRY